MNSHFKRTLLCAMVLGLASCLLVPNSSMAVTIFSENFNGLALGPNVEEGLNGANVWTSTPPPVWTIDRTVDFEKIPLVIPLTHLD